MERSKIAAYSAKNQWHFLRNCLQEQVLPVSMQCRKDTNADGVAFPDHHRAKLKDAIKNSLLKVVSDSTEVHN